MCTSQLVLTAGGVQKLSFFGVVLVFTVSAVLVLASLCLEPLADSAERWLGCGLAARRARRERAATSVADDIGEGASRRDLGCWGVSVSADADFDRPKPVVVG